MPASPSRAIGERLKVRAIGTRLVVVGIAAPFFFISLTSGPARRRFITHPSTGMQLRILCPAERVYAPEIRIKRTQMTI